MTIRNGRYNLPGNDRRWEWGAQGDNNTSIATQVHRAPHAVFVRSADGR
jgi:hypothetical protein